MTSPPPPKFPTRTRAPGSRNGMGSKCVFWQISPGKGRGVFAYHALHKGLLVLVDPVFIFKTADLPPTALDDYRMAWTDEEDCIALGLTNLINHSDDPNVVITDDIPGCVKRVTVVKHIAEGTELLAKYRCPIWWEKT